jgi:hypothetical protein
MYPSSTTRRLRSLLVPVMLLAAPAFSQVVINEICASNRTGLADGFNRREDWIELFNLTAAPVNIGGWYLTDKTSNPTKWQIPAGVTVPANGYLVFICSGRDVFDGTRWHTNFGISQMDQERITLTSDALVTVDFYKLLTPTQRNHSHARLVSGGLVWGKSTIPTPGAANSNTFERYANRPTLSLEAGFYPGAQSVSIINNEPGTTIRYTTNGNAPTAASPIYTAPIPVNATTVLRAAAYTTDPTLRTSFVETNTYFIRPPHTVPSVSVSGMVNYITTGTFSSGDQIVSVEYFDANGVFQWELDGEIRRHGNDSWAFPQKGFRIHTRDQFGTADEIDHPLFPTAYTDREKFGTVIFKAAGSDNYPFHGYLASAHLRDGWIQTASQKGGLDLDERTYNHQITYFNGGYWGVYELRERVDKDYTEYYYDQGEYDVDMLKFWGGLVIEHGTNAGWNALYNFVNANSLTIDANYEYVLSQIDKENFIDNFILNTFMVNSDWLNWNTMWWRGNKPPGVKWRYALWDLDNIANLGQNYTGWVGGTGPTVNTVCNLQNMFQNASASNGHAKIYTKLLQNPDFFWSYVNRYADLLNTALHCDTLNALLDQFETKMLPEMPGQFTRWGGNMTTWQNNIQAIRNFNCTRWNIVMGQIVDCFDDVYPISGPYQLTVQIVGDGDVQVNTIVIPAGPWTGQWFGGAEMLFDAIPGVNSYFSHWEIDQNYVGQDLLNPATWLQLLTSDTITAYFVEMPALPVELLSFTGTKRDADVLLEWTTATEFNSAYFHVERRTQGEGWRVVGRQDAAGHSLVPVQYSLVDPAPENGVNYYRLRQVDLDGSFKYSDVVAVDFQATQNSVLHIWPNPTGEGANLSNLSDRDLYIDMLTADGRLLKRIFLGANKQRFYDLQDYPAGVYLLQVRDGGRMFSERLVIVR